MGGDSGEEEGGGDGVQRARNATATKRRARQGRTMYIHRCLPHVGNGPGSII